MKNNNTLALVALAAGGMLFANTARAADKASDKTQKEKSACSGPNGCDGKDYKCVAGNSCKGKSACNTEASKCKGTNSCAGKGWVSTKDEKACKDLIEANAKAAKKKSDKKS